MTWGNKLPWGGGIPANSSREVSRSAGGAPNLAPAKLEKSVEELSSKQPKNRATPEVALAQTVPAQTVSWGPLRLTCMAKRPFFRGIPLPEELPSQTPKAQQIPGASPWRRGMTLPAKSLVLPGKTAISGQSETAKYWPADEVERRPIRDLMPERPQCPPAFRRSDRADRGLDQRVRMDHARPDR